MSEFFVRVNTFKILHLFFRPSLAIRYKVLKLFSGFIRGPNLGLSELKTFAQSNYIFMRITFENPSIPAESSELIPPSLVERSIVSLLIKTILKWSEILPINGTTILPSHFEWLSVGEKLMATLFQYLNWKNEQMKHNHNATIPLIFTSLFVDEDDVIIELMSDLLSVNEHYKKKQSLIQTNKNLQTAFEHYGFDPHNMFVAFLETISFDETVFIDLLIDGEGNFLEYVVKYVHILLTEIKATSKEEFKQINLRVAESTRFLSKLREKIFKYDQKNLFPYNIQPLLVRLTEIQQQSFLS
jgi:hypothetical protein